MAGPGQADLQAVAGKAVDFTRLQYQQDSTNKVHGESLQAREQAAKAMQSSQVQKQEGPHNAQVDGDGSGGQAAYQRRRKQHGQEEDAPAPKTLDMMPTGRGNRLDLTV